MELVIFFIIIMIILSSLSKYLQGGGEQEKQEDPFDFQGSDKPSSLDDFFEYLKGEGDSAEEKGSSGRGSEYRDLGTQEKGKLESYRGEESRASVYTESSPEGSYVPSTSSKGQVTAKGRDRRKKRKEPTGRSSPSAVSSSRGFQEGNRAYTSLRKDKSDLEGELQELLMSDKVYLGIAAAEILGPPRSKKPYRRRI